MDTQVRDCTEIPDVKSLLGKSWSDAEADYRNIVSRDSFTRLIFVSSLKDISNTEVHGSQIDINKLNHLIFNKGNDSSGSNQQKRNIHWKHTVEEGIQSQRVPMTTGCLIFISETDDEENVPVMMFGFIEAAPGEVLDKLRCLKNSSEWISRTRVLLNSEDCPVREFPSGFSIFTTRSLPENYVDLEEEGGAENVIESIIKSICEEAANFPVQDNSLPSVANNSSMQVGVNDTTPDFEIQKLTGSQRKVIPSISRLNACLENDFFPTAEEFLDLFASPIFLSLESENVYPSETIDLHELATTNDSDYL